MSARLLRDVLIALATFLVVGAGTIRVLVPPVLVAEWPLTQTTTRAVAASATVLDPVTLELERDVTLVQRRVVTPFEAGVDGATGYTVSTSTRRDDGTAVLRQRWSGLQATRTGLAVASSLNTEVRTRATSSGDAVEETVPLPSMRGHLLRFAPSSGGTDQPRWDPQTRTTGVAGQDPQAGAGGDEVVVLRHRVDATPVEPGSGTTVASDTRLWVRPVLGAVVRTSTHLVIRSGTSVVLDATFVDDEASVAAATESVTARETLTSAWAVVVPVALLVTGLGVAVGAVVVSRRRDAT